MRLAILIVVALLTFTATAQADRGYLHKTDAHKAAKRYANAQLNPGETDEVHPCRRRADRVVDCEVTFPGLAPDGSYDPKWSSDVIVRVTMHDGHIRAHMFEWD